MTRYNSLADDFYVNVHLNNEMELPESRDSLMLYFEQVQKKYPTMRHFYNRDRGEYVLEEDKMAGHYRWTSLDARRICSGYVNPPSTEEAMEQHRTILELVPYTLSISPLGCESLNLMFGFDFTFSGNHNALIAEALGVPHGLDRLLEVPGAAPVGYEPGLQIALGDDYRTHCRVSVEPRTGATHLRYGEYSEEQLSVYVTARRYGGIDPGETFGSTLQKLTDLCREVLDQCVVGAVLEPLQRAIALH